MSIQSIVTEGSWDEVLDGFLYELEQSVDFEAGSLFIFENDSQTLKEISKKGDGIDFISSISFPLGNGLSAWVAQKGKLIYLPDIHRGSRHGMNPVRSYLSIPLEVNHSVIGVLNLGHTLPGAFDEENMDKIRIMAKEVARKIYNHRYLTFVENEDHFAH